MMADRARTHQPQAIAAIEARGFVFGGAIAARLGIGFVPIRKAGKLPAPVRALDYALEYGTDRIEIAADRPAPGTRTLLVDGLVATGGTARAACALLRGAGAELAGALFLIDLPDLGGADALRGEGTPAEALLSFAADEPQ